MLEKRLPIKRNEVRQYDKPLMTPLLKMLSTNVKESGKSSAMFKYWRKKVIIDVKSARNKYYSSSISRRKHGNIVEGAQVYRRFVIYSFMEPSTNIPDNPTRT